MPFDGSGIFQRVRNWVADAAAGVKIRADLHDSEDDGFALGLTNCITKDGQSTITQNIPWNNKRITSLADPINPQDAATKAYTDVKVGAMFPLTGGKLTGDIEIEKVNPALILDSTANPSSNALHGHMLNKQRWLMRLGNGETEPGSGNLGSNFDLHHYGDGGEYLGQALRFDRNTGLGVVKGDPTASNGIATKSYADTAAVNNAAGKVNRSGDTMGGGLYSAAPNVGILHGGSPDTLEVRSSGGGDAIMSFHRTGAFGTNFGLRGDNNFWYGGWSHAGQAWRFWTTRDFAALPSQGAVDFKFVHMADWNTVADNQMQEPYNGAVMTGINCIVGAGPDGWFTYINQFRFRQMQVNIGGQWYTVAYGTRS